MPHKYLRLVALLYGLCLPGLLHAQLSNATVKGTVTDPSSSVIPQVSVTLRNTGTGEHWEKQTTQEGTFDFPALSPGEYEVKVSAPGFADWTGQLTLRVGQQAVVNPQMQTATTQTTITVADVTPVINTDNGSISDVKEAERIASLPVQNRNFLNILNFTPGVVSNSFAGQGSGYTRVNGIPGGSMDYQVDGMTAAERYTNELQRLPQPLPTIQELKVDTSNTSAEYSRPGMVEVVTKSGTNDFHGQLFELYQGNALAAKIFHQESVNFLVHNEFGGNFSGPVWIPKLYNGKNKTFFFVDAESIRQSAAASERYTVPLQSWKQGNFSNFVDNTGNPVIMYDPLTTSYNAATGSYVRNPFPGNIIPQNRQNPIALKVLNAIPNPNVNIPYYLGQNYQNPNASSQDKNTFVTAKMDQLFGVNRLAARYTYTDRSNFGPGYLLNPEDRLYGGDNGAISFTESISPSIINEVRAGVQYFHAYRGPQIISPPITSTLGLPTYPGTVAWPSFYFDSTYTFDGIDRDNPQDAPGATINFSDNLTWTRGQHELKMGFFFQHSAVNTFETGQPGGDYQFLGGFTGLMDPSAAAQGIYNVPVGGTGAGLADMLLGYVDGAFLNQYPKFYTRQADYAGYLNDNWKISRRLTLNLGLRYEYWTPFSDKRDQASTLDLNAPGGPAVVYAGSGPITKQGFPQSVVDAYQAAGLQILSSKQAGYPNSLWNMQKNNWAPRIGAAYQLNDKTVIRGGYGIYYWVMPLVQYHQNTRKNPPFSYSFQSVTDNDNPMAAELAFPAGGSTWANQSPDARILGTQFITPNALNISQGAGWNILPWETNYKTQLAQEWNITLERELPWKLGARVSYVGNHAGNLINYDPINTPVPALLAPGLTPVQRRPYPDFAVSSTNSMDMLRFIGYSNSNQLQSELKRNFSNGLVLQGFFTWQKTLTTSEGTNGSYSGLEMIPATLTNNASTAQRLREIYAPDSGLPVYNISFNGNYELPFGEKKRYLANTNGFVRRLVSGWNVSGFYYWRSGLPFSPYYYPHGGTPIVLAPGKNGILPADQRQAAGWFDASIDRADLGQPYTGQTFIQLSPAYSDFYNNIPRNYMTGPGFYNIDASFYKVTSITERVKFRLEAQVFDLLNHKNFGQPNNLGVINTGVSGPVGAPTVGLSRLVQFQGKIEF